MEHPPLIRFLIRHRPPLGWLPLLLLGGGVAALALSVLDVGWVPNDAIVVPALAGGFLVATWLAAGRARPLAAWVILLALGAAVAVILAAGLLPPPRVVGEGGAAVADFWRIRAALFADRAAGWLVAVRGGGRSTETVVFALGLAAAGWLVAAALAWSTYRMRRPFLGLALVGAALAANTFYGRAGLHWVVLFFGLAVAAATYASYLYRELAWEHAGIDYSAEVRADLLIYTAGVSLGVMSLAMALPAINFRAIAETFQRQEAVIAAEQTMARAFAGVAQPRTDEGAAGGGGGMPRAFLLGGDPALAETVVMTATLQAEPLVDLAPFHWRSVSFDLYTGRGWRRSPEREEPIDSGEAIPLPDEAGGPGAARVRQAVNWTYDRRATRYTVGRPVVFSHDLTVMWRGTDDLVGVRGRNNAPNRYTAETVVVAATADRLRAARPEDAPPEIRARYTDLPDTVTDRTRVLAREVTAGQPTAYDQARAIEQFLRQYPYSLDLPPLPADVDVVDYFLFDLQMGFCDYYASSMVVMARAIGLPARLGVGFLQQPAGADGAQTIRQIDAHSWAEVYFAGVGWVEFEPTAAVAAPASVPAPAAGGSPPATYTPGGAAVAIPERAPQRETPWALWVAVAAAALVGWRLWGRRLGERLRAPRETDDTRRAYDRLQTRAAALGRPARPNQTPAEFAAALLDAPALRRPDAAPLRPAVARLVELFAARQYGAADPATTGAAASAAAETVDRPLQRLAWRRGLRKWLRIETEERE